MASITAVWTENTNLHTSGTVAAGATATDDIDLDASGYDMVAVTVEIAFGATPDGDTVVDIFGSTNSGTDDDTIALTSVTIPSATSTTKRITLMVSNMPYIAVAVTNNDTTDTVTYDGWYAGRKWDST